MLYRARAVSHGVIDNHERQYIYFSIGHRIIDAMLVWICDIIVQGPYGTKSC